MQPVRGATNHEILTRCSSLGTIGKIRRSSFKKYFRFAFPVYSNFKVFLPVSTEHFWDRTPLSTRQSQIKGPALKLTVNLEPDDKIVVGSPVELED